MEGASNLKGSGSRIVLQGLQNISIIEYLRFEYIASNNQTKYKAFIADMALARELGMSNLEDQSDSQRVIIQVSCNYHEKDT